MILHVEAFIFAMLVSNNVWAVYGVVTNTEGSCLACPAASTAKQAQGLSTGAKIGIGVTIGVFAVALACVGIVELCYLKRRRRERAIRNAVEEVERGVDKGSQEMIVMDSSVSIVFDDEAYEENEGGRNGMSLPRRE